MDNLLSFLLAAAIIGAFLLLYLHKQKKREAKVRASVERRKLEALF